MKLNPEDQARLEQLIEHACCEQPVRKAPAALRLRVLAELERRAALPWWRKSFGHWPMAMRIAFVLASIGVVRATLNMTMWLNDKLVMARPVSRPMSWIQNFSAFVSFLHSLSDYVGSTLLHRIPAPVLYAGALGVVVMYGLLIGLSATAYRTLYAAR